MAADTHRQSTARAAAAARLETFIRLFTENRRRLALYVLGLTPNRHDAEELLQETHLVLWRKFDRFTPGTNFAAWACKVALRQAIAWQKRRRHDRLLLGPKVLAALAAEQAAAADRLDARLAVLERGVARLPARQREVLRLRYAEDCPIDEMARRLGRTPGAVYRELSRIRRGLMEYVTAALAEETGR
jgi:RNA polymerase sigma-70 factor (ECF subfamily)